MGSVCIKLRLQPCHVVHTSQVCQLLLFVQSLVTVREDHSLETSTQCNTDQKSTRDTSFRPKSHGRCGRLSQAENKVEWARGALDR